MRALTALPDLNVFRPLNLLLSELLFSKTNQSDPLFWYEPSTPLGKRHFNITNVDSLPKVTVLYAYQDMDVGLLKAAVDLGAKGIVIAGEVRR